MSSTVGVLLKFFVSSWWRWVEWRNRRALAFDNVETITSNAGNGAFLAQHSFRSQQYAVIKANQSASTGDRCATPSLPLLFAVGSEETE